MARLTDRLEGNAPGDLYVDSSCIDCGTCRWMAPETFDRLGDASRVYRQPQGPAQTLAALRALVACPTASIGATERHDVAAVARGFPVEIQPGVYHCGYHHEASFGAASYLIVRPGGNVLVDSPRLAAPLAARLASMGGIRWMFLTHRDDVGDHEAIAARFGCERILHAHDVGPSTRGVERKLAGDAPIRLAEDLLVIPTPGHTRGSACLLYTSPTAGDARVLFTGDYLAWSRGMGQLYAFRRACWYDWEAQTASMRRLLRYDFERVLPGHGAPASSDAATTRARLEACVAWMEAQ